MLLRSWKSLWLGSSVWKRLSGNKRRRNSRRRALIPSHQPQVAGVVEALEDRVLLSAATPNLGLASSDAVLDGHIAAFTVNENTQGGADLNGDGDINDTVLHVYDASTETITNLGIGVTDVMVEGNIVAFTASEAQEGKDLNSDGDQTDAVLHVYDLTDESINNVGVAAIRPQLENNRIGFLVREFNQGNTDLNGDGDTFDFVPHVYDISSGATNNLEVAAIFTNSLAGDLMVVEVSEFANGATDLNGDGDVFDQVLHVHDATTGITRNLGLASRVDSSGRFQMDGNLVAIHVREADQGNMDLNGNGTTFDTVLHVYNAADQSITKNFGLQGASLGNVGGNRVAFSVFESQQGMDLNGDRDTNDPVLHVHDFATGTTTNVGFASIFVPSFHQFDGDRIAFRVTESFQGSDLDGDGSVSSNDHVVVVYDAASGTVSNTGVAAREFLLDGNVVAIQESDAFYNDELHVHELASGVTTNLGLIISDFHLDGNSLAFNVREAREFSDLNGDGDILDNVLHVYDATTGTIGNLGLEASSELHFGLKENLLRVNVRESAQAGEDLNGDGDASDRVLHVFNLAAPFSDAPKIESVEVGSDLESFTIQLNDTSLQKALAEDVSNYRLVIANGDANGDGDFFNDGDETDADISSAIYDLANDRITLHLVDAVFADVYRLEVEGDDARLDGTSGIANENDFFMLGGDFQIDFDLRVLTLVEALLDKVESLGLATSAEQSLTGRLTAATQVLGADVDRDDGLTHILESFRLGVQGWLDRGEITLAERDDLFADVDLLLLGLALTDEDV